MPTPTTTLVSLAQNAGFSGSDLTTAVAIALAESSGNPNAYNPVNSGVPQGQGAIGLWQIYLNVHPEFSGYNLKDPQQNAAAAFAVYRNSGNSFQPWETYTNGQYASYLQQASNAVNGTALSTTSGGALLGDNPNPANAVVVQNATSPDNFKAMLNQNLEIFDATMTEVPWYADPGLLTGNPRIREFEQPVSFQVYLSQNGTMLTTAQNSSQPITLQLNCSLREYNLLSKHIYNRQPSRTGMHITFWGMAPDQITGSGSTGVFMNQFGLTDFFSVANIDSSISSLLAMGETFSFNPTVAQTFNGSSGEVAVNTVGGNSGAYQTISNLQLGNPAEALRVAAQDAFVEFLKLFQMNGNVWYYTPNYQGNLTGMEQVAPAVWAPNRGATNFQQNSRNNDVLTKGYVLMKYRNNTYLGYFKSLSWRQSADKPFSWEFNFVFQVERTSTSYFFPVPGF